MSALGAALALLLALLPAASVSAAKPQRGGAVAYQLNPAHTGATPDELAADVTQRWSVDLGGDISYPLIVGNRVYVTARNPDSSYGSQLYALDAITGQRVWGPVQLGGVYFWSALAYDGGRVFTVNYDGQMRAFNATSGRTIWTLQLPGQYSFSSPPTAIGGRVYVGGAGSGGTVYAVDGAKGRVLWTAPVANGDNSSPAVSSSGVYVSYACGQAYAFNPLSGVPLWHRATDCSGGGGKTPVLAGGRLYVRDHSYPAVLNASTGAELAPFSAFGPAPAVDATSRYQLSGGALSAADVDSGETRWSFSGDGALSTAPIVAGRTVVVGSTYGNLYGLSSTTGAVLWSRDIGSSIAGPDEQNVSQPLTGLATSGGLLIVPAGQRLVALR